MCTNKFLVAIMATALLCNLFTSCKDDEEEPVNGEYITPAFVNSRSEDDEILSLKAETTEGNLLYFNILSKTTCLVSKQNWYRNGNLRGTLTIPLKLSLDGNIVNVVSLNDEAFLSYEELTEVAVPEGIMSIGDYAFRNCRKLRSVKLPQNVTLGKGLFAGCTNLKDIELPENLAKISDMMFPQCMAITSFDVPETVTEIGYDAFRECKNLKTVSLPSNLKSIGASAFSGCSELQSVSYCGKKYERAYALIAALEKNGVVVAENCFHLCGFFSVEMPY